MPSHTLLSSLLPRSTLGVVTHASHPHTRRPLTLGLAFGWGSHSPSGVSFVPTRSAPRLRVKMAAWAASPHSDWCAPAWCMAARVLSKTVRLARSAMPLCCGVYGSVVVAVMPLDWKNCCSSREMNSPPPLEWNSTIATPCSATAARHHSTMRPAASLLRTKQKPKILRVNSSTSSSR